MLKLFRKNRRRRTAQTPQSSIQCLENRQLLAGDVAVALSSADSRDLVITGDDSANEIVVEEIGVDRIRVQGRNGTQVNGGSSATFTVRDDVTINMKGGNDVVTVRNLNLDNYTHNDLVIDLGTGNDTLVVEQTDVSDDLNVYAGHGHDDIEILEVRTRDTFVTGEYGNDDITIDEVTTHNTATIAGAENADTIEVRDSVIGNDLVIDGDAGADEVSVDGVDVADNISVDLGSGDDYSAVTRSDADDIFVYGRTGNDTVYLYYNDVVDQLYASLSTGNDELIFWGNAVGRHYFNGGTGTDKWRNPNLIDYFWTWSNFYNFE